MYGGHGFVGSKPNSVITKCYAKKKLKYSMSTDKKRVSVLFTFEEKRKIFICSMTYSVMDKAAEYVEGPFFSKVIPITKESAKHYKNQKLKTIHFKLLKKACLYDIGFKVIEGCVTHFLPTLEEHMKILAQKGKIILICLLWV